MKEIVYIPYCKRFFLFMWLIVIIVYPLRQLLCGNIKYGCIYFLVSLILGIYALTFTGKLKIDESGILALSSKGKLLAHIPWSEIAWCKTFPGYFKSNSGKFCVCFKNMMFLDSESGKPLIRKKMMDTKSNGDILCDFDLRKLCFGRMTPEAFAEKDVFAFLANDTQGEQVRLWWSQANEPDASSVNDQSGDRPI